MDIVLIWSDTNVTILKWTNTTLHFTQSEYYLDEKKGKVRGKY